jgi:polysaccharide export outer membrane protein
MRRIMAMSKDKRYWITFLAAAILAVSAALGQNETLLIGPGDSLHVQVFDTPELEQHARVTDAGDMPLVIGGNVHVAGLTPAQAAHSIEDTLQKGQFLLHPKVAITVEEYATQKVSVVGEVKTPGAYAINTPRSILDVLTMAGGLTDIADRKVLIERHGTKQRIPYFLSNNADTALDSVVEVKPGDSVLVPKAGIVYVLGDVARPGGYTMTNNEAQLTVLQLIARAGGTNHSAVPSHAELIHRKGSSFVEEPLALSAMQKGHRADMPLQPDDVVWVPFSYLRNFGLQATEMLGEVGSAAVYRF